MYFVDRKTIEEKLTLMDDYLQFFNSKKDWTMFSDKLILERVVHIVIEAILDVGNSIIDGFVMRDPGSYEDIIDIFLDEKVVEEKDGESYKVVIALRKMVVRDYTNVDHESMKEIFTENSEALMNFGPSVKQYLKKELGQVTAFIPE
jgi:uncharacterized protein YutE (UPF0331/DUF86 family)